MFKIFFFLFYFILSLEALLLDFNTQDIDILNNKISSDLNIALVKKEPKVAYEKLDKSSSIVDEKDALRKSLQIDYGRVKRLQEYLVDSTLNKEVKSKIQKSFFSLNANKKQRLSFAYALKYPISEDYDAVYAKMQQKISLYILQTYGVSNVEYKQVMKNLSFDSEKINTRSIGTVEVVPSVKNKYHYKENNSIATGIVVFDFFPFKEVKRNDSESSKIDYSSSSSKEIIEFIDFEKEKDIKRIEKFFIDGDDTIFREYLDEFLGTVEVDISKTLASISKKRSAYTKVANKLFERYPQCKDLGCLDKTISNQIAKASIHGGNREFIYEYILSNDLELSDAIYMAYRKLKRNLSQDTVVNSVDSSESLMGENFKKSKFL